MLLLQHELKELPLLAVDLEYHNALPGEEGCVIISLIQISTHKTDYIFDCFMLRNHMREDRGLANIFGDSEVLKILHGCDSDLKYIIADLKMVMVNLFDTARGMAYVTRVTPYEMVKKSQM